MLLPQEIAEQLNPHERMNLAAIVEEKWAQEFGVVRVVRSKSKVEVTIELDDRTRHDVDLK